jgi:hypothetical protein
MAGDLDSKHTNWECSVTCHKIYVLISNKLKYFPSNVDKQPDILVI